MRKCKYIHKNPRELSMAGREIRIRRSSHDPSASIHVLFVRLCLSWIRNFNWICRCCLRFNKKNEMRADASINPSGSHLLLVNRTQRFSPYNWGSGGIPWRIYRALHLPSQVSEWSHFLLIIVSRAWIKKDSNILRGQSICIEWKAVVWMDLKILRRIRTEDPCSLGLKWMGRQRMLHLVTTANIAVIRIRTDKVDDEDKCASSRLS